MILEETIIKRLWIINKGTDISNATDKELIQFKVEALIMICIFSSWLNSKRTGLMFEYFNKWQVEKMDEIDHLFTELKDALNE